MIASKNFIRSAVANFRGGWTAAVTAFEAPPSGPASEGRVNAFNYDGILERVLAKQFSNVEEQFGSYSDYFEIIHPHGYCGDILDEYDNVWKALTERAANISVVNEPPSKVPQIVTEARARDN